MKKSRLLIGARNTNLEEAMTVVNGTAAVVLDAAVLGKIMEASEKVTESSPFVPGEKRDAEHSGSRLSRRESRAVLLGMLIAVFQDSVGVRGGISEVLAGALNDEVEVELMRGSEVEDLVRFVADKVDGGIFAHEALVMKSSEADVRGELVLKAYDARETVALAEVAAALTLDTTRRDCTLLSTEFSDVRSPHVEQGASASMLRVLLQDSTRGVSTEGGEEGRGLVAPHVSLGAARAAVRVAAREARVALNAVPLVWGGGVRSAVPGSKEASGGVKGCKEVKTFVGGASTAVMAPMAAVDLALEMVRRESLERVRSGVKEEAEEMGKDVVARCRQTVLDEIEFCNRVLAEEEEGLQERDRRKEQKRLEREQAMKEAEEKKRAAMTDEERAKYDAKQAAIAEKKRKKAEKKTAAPTTSSSTSSSPEEAFLSSRPSVGLGKGLSIVRAKLILEPVAESATWSVFQYTRALFEELGRATKGKPRLPKGTRDFAPEQMAVRAKAFAVIREVFRRHGAAEIDTPVFEMRETLTGKYGEEGGKLIYDLADQGGELLSLRYDLTVPFARYVAMNGLDHLKRFHIARVYRRDTPQPTRGRFREFYQCDFDVAGAFASAPMMADSEVLSVACEILTELDVGDFVLKLSHRGLLDGMLDLAGVPSAKFRNVCSSIDKLDKEEWTDVREELLTERGLAESTVAKIGERVALKGHPSEILPLLQADEALVSHPLAGPAIKDLDLLFRYLGATGHLDRISLDLSLARGLDYYTGVIYEAIVRDGDVNVGSIAAGGRYDNLVGMFSPSGAQVPCVGVSIGVERVFALLEARGQGVPEPTQVFVMAVGGFVEERLAICRELWARGISAETLFHAKPKMARQLEAALEKRVPFAIVIGSDEVEAQVVNIKIMQREEQKTVKRTEMIQVLLDEGCIATKP